MKHNRDNKKPYQKPAVIFSKRIEVISAVCGSARNNRPGCMKSVGAGCTRLLS